jgi:hypothetical protein
MIRNTASLSKRFDEVIESHPDLTYFGIGVFESAELTPEPTRRQRSTGAP